MNAEKALTVDISLPYGVWYHYGFDWQDEVLLSDVTDIFELTSDDVTRVHMFIDLDEISEIFSSQGCHCYLISFAMNRRKKTFDFKFACNKQMWLDEEDHIPSQAELRDCLEWNLGEYFEEPIPISNAPLSVYEEMVKRDDGVDLYFGGRKLNINTPYLDDNDFIINIQQAMPDSAYE